MEAQNHPRTRFHIPTLPRHPNIASLCNVCYEGGDCASPFILPFGPSILGMGFLVAFTVLIRGTPWSTRGSFINVGSSFAGAVACQHLIFALMDNGDKTDGGGHTSCNDCSDVSWNPTLGWCGGCCSPKVIICV